MTLAVPTSGLQLRSLVKASGELELSLVRAEIPPLAPDQVLIRVEAAPVNPSDVRVLVGTADLATLRKEGTGEALVTRAEIPPASRALMAGRLDRSLTAGNEGAGVVVAAGTADEARALLGKTVAVFSGAMYAQYCVVRVASCLVLPDGTAPRDGASCFVNPLTALCMVETMRLEGHTALVHAAAASNLGQMLCRICQADGVELVNIVRSAEQEALLRSLGAVHVCNSSTPDFMDRLTDVIAATKATLAFDPIGGGELAGQILGCMEAVLNRDWDGPFRRYGSPVQKQVYIYGGLDPRPTLIDRSFGMAWGIGGWLLWPALSKVGPTREQELRNRVARELKTTFASHFTSEIALADLLQPDILKACKRSATGQKILINPHKSE
ncbi:MAG: zinc-binding dehydrogenase [Steroidobacteraceae bacterium]